MAAARELELQDLLALDASGPSKTLPELQRLKESHHAIARYLAVGLKASDICRITNYSPVTISILQRSEVFQELIATYREMAEAKAFDLQGRISFIAGMTLDRIQERLESPGADEVPLDHLRRLAKDLVDRDGYSPIRRSVDVRVRVSGESLQRIKDAAKALTAGSLDLGVADREDAEDGTVVEISAIEEGLDLGGAGV